MVFVISERVIQNGSGDSVSLNEKLAWDSGKKPYVVLHPKCCVHIWKEKGKPTLKLYL